MKDRLGKNKWWNLPARNPTQNRYRRFVKTPQGKMTSRFKELGDEFKSRTIGKLDLGG